ncbi:MAG: hypothetical protein WD897_02240 [Parcubacteria group bacterium]
MEPEQNKVNVEVEEGGGSSGLIIGAVIILAIIILGGLYFWGQRADNEAMIDEIGSQSNSDEAAAIEADLNATDIENIDAELNAS